MLAPPPPVEPIADVAAAVRDALRFPLAGQPLEALVPRGGRATVVVEPPALPIPGSHDDPRRNAIAATMLELDRAGAPLEQADAARRRRAGPAARATASWSSSCTPSSPDGSTAGSRCTTPRARTWWTSARTATVCNPALADADIVVAVSAAETVLNGGPATLLAASSPDALRAADAYSLLETSVVGRLEACRRARARAGERGCRCSASL